MIIDKGGKMKTACQVLTLVFFLSAGISMFSADDDNSKNWTSLPENARKEILSSLAQQFPMPDNKKAAPESEYQETLKKWKSNIEKQKDFLARHWLKTHQGDSDKAMNIITASPAIATPQPQMKPSTAAKEIKPIRTTEKAADTPLPEPAAPVAKMKQGDITVSLAKAEVDEEITKRMPFGRKTIGGQSDKPLRGEKPPSVSMSDQKYGALFLGRGLSLSTVIFKSKSSGKYDRLILDLNNDKDFSNDKVIEISESGTGKELNIKIGDFDETFMLRNQGAGPFIMMDYKYLMKGSAQYKGRSVNAALFHGFDGKYSYGSQLFLDLNGNGKMDSRYAMPGQSSSKASNESFMLSKYISLDNDFYSVEIDPSGTSVKLSRNSEKPAKIDLKAKFISSMGDAMLSFSSNTGSPSSTFMPLINHSWKIGDLPISVPAENFETTNFRIMNGQANLSFKYNKLTLSPGQKKDIELLPPAFDINASIANDMINVDLKWLPVNGVEYSTINPGVAYDKNLIKITVEAVSGAVLLDGTTGWG